MIKKLNKLNVNVYLCVWLSRVNCYSFFKRPQILLYVEDAMTIKANVKGLIFSVM